MKKTILMTMLVCTFLNACAYKPIVKMLLIDTMMI